MQKEGEVLVISFQRMSQRRNRGKGKDHLSNVIKYEQSEPTPQSCDFLFDEIHPENSFTSPMSIQYSIDNGNCLSRHHDAYWSVHCSVW